MSTTHGHEPIAPADPSEPVQHDAPSGAAPQEMAPTPSTSTPTQGNPTPGVPDAIPENPGTLRPEPTPGDPEIPRRPGLFSTKGRKIGAAVVGVGIVAGVVGGVEAMGGPSGHKAVAEQSADPSNTQSPSPNATNSASQKPSNSPPATSIPTTPAETIPNPNEGSVDLTTKTAGENVIRFENDSVSVLTATASSRPQEIANAWLSQYAYILYRGSASQGPSKGYDSNVQLVEQTMTSDQAVLTSLQSAIDNWRAGVGSSDVMPIFWDSPSNPADFTKSTDAAGHTVITLSENGGPLYLNTYDPSAPWNDPSNDKWQDPHGRNVAKATKISSFSLTIDGSNQNGQPNIIGWSLLS